MLTARRCFSRLVTVTVRVELVPSATVPKLKLVGEKVTGALPAPGKSDRLGSRVVGNRDAA